jgi:diguanylate cyclase (GGDEF)-like protein
MTSSHRHQSSSIEGSQVADFLAHLGHAVQAHRNWLDRLNHALVCQSEIPPADLEPDAHSRCSFGRWYAEASLPRGLPDEALERFSRIGIDHQRMHALAREVLLSQDRAHPEASANYLAFTESVRDLGHAVEKLAGFLQERFYAVDALTGLLNRHAMYADLERLAPSINCREDSAAIAMVDIDFFKEVNDTYGHAAGDLVLRSVAKTLLRQTRRGDQVYRYGGEEMLLLLHDTDQTNLQSLLEHIRRSIADQRTSVPSCGEIAVTVSFGVAWLEPGQPLHACIEAADRALYVAKSAGRNCVRWGSAG